MKKLEIIIREINVDEDDFTPIEDKTFINDTLHWELDEQMLPYFIYDSFHELAEYYLKDRDNVPFTPIPRSDYEN